jgi:chitin-binding protein
MRLRKKTTAAAVGLAASLALLFAGGAQGHGWISTPPSRAAYCAAGTVTNCGDIQWEPQSVEGPKGFPAAGPSDGTICSGGIARFAQLDDPRGGAWPTTALTAGNAYDFTWTLTAAHATTSFRYFITKNSYNPALPLTRSDLVATPIFTQSYGGKQPPTTVTHHVTIPAGLTGHHIVLGVWDIADTGNAFYQCTDVSLS